LTEKLWEKLVYLYNTHLFYAITSWMSEVPVLTYLLTYVLTGYLVPADFYG